MAKETRYIIRVVNTDLAGNKKIGVALCKIKGVGRMLANGICHIAGIDRNVKAGDLSEEEEKRLNELLKNPERSGVPSWLLNRRKDPETGEDLHLVGPDVTFVKDNDIKAMRKMKSYRGTRHMHGLPARGQRTGSNFRKNKTRGSSRRKALRRK